MLFFSANPEVSSFLLSLQELVASRASSSKPSRHAVRPSEQWRGVGSNVQKLRRCTTSLHSSAPSLFCPSPSGLLSSPQLLSIADSCCIALQYRRWTFGKLTIVTNSPSFSSSTSSSPSPRTTSRRLRAQSARPSFLHLNTSRCSTARSPKLNMPSLSMLLLPHLPL
jgi:hypothetical protein